MQHKSIFYVACMCCINTLVAYAASEQGGFQDFAAEVNQALPTEDGAADLANSLATQGTSDNPFENSAASSTPAYGLANSTTRLQYAGTGTISYADRPLTTTGAIDLSCGTAYLGPNFVDSYIGVGSSFYYRSFSCGRCVRLQCDDLSCETVGKQATALVVDSCGECYGMYL